MKLWYVEISDYCSDQYVESIHMTYKGALKSICHTLSLYLADIDWDEEENIKTIEQAKAKNLETLSTAELEELKDSLQELGELSETYSEIKTATLEP
jgi:hypothetical protein